MTTALNGRNFSTIGPGSIMFLYPIYSCGERYKVTKAMKGKFFIVAPTKHEVSLSVLSI